MRVSLRLFAGLVSVKPKAGGDFKVVFIGAGKWVHHLAQFRTYADFKACKAFTLDHLKDHGTYAFITSASIAF